MLTTTGGILIRTPVSSMRTIGRNTQGVVLIKVEEEDTVSSLAKLPEEELGTADELPDAELDPNVGDIVADVHPPHIINDGVAEAEASDHIDETEPDGEQGADD
jgi:DNA gyrase subunit A